MSGEDAASPEPAFCPHCGTAHVPWARFCPKCGNAVAMPPSGPEAVSTPSAPKAAHPIREALVTVGVLIVAIGVVGAVLAWRGIPFNLFGAHSIPPAGQIWFGDSYNASTFEMHELWTSVSTGRPISCVAHTTRDVAANGAKLHIDLEGTTLADQALGSLSGPGDLIGFTFTPPAAGTYAFSIVGTDGSVLATGSLPAQ